MSTLQGKTILIAGGTGKVGRHLVQAQLAAGATAIVPSRNPAKLDALEGSIDVGGLMAGADAPQIRDQQR